MRDRPEFVSKEAGAKALGISPKVFERIAAQGHFGVRALPGMLTRYRLSDVEAFRDRHTVPALVGAES